MEKASKIGAAVGGLEVLCSAHYGAGLKIYELHETEQGDALFQEKIPSSMPEIYDFFDRTQFELTLSDIIADYETFGVAFVEYILSPNGQEIISVVRQQASYCRFEKPKNGIIHNVINYSVGIEGEEMATSKGIRKLSFGVLRNDVPPDDYEAEYQAIDEMEQLALKIASRMRFDSNNTSHFLYGAFKKNTLEIRPVELEGDGIFGVEVSFTLSSKQSLKLSPDDWKDIDKVC